jgi:hypothetical protein
MTRKSAAAPDRAFKEVGTSSPLPEPTPQKQPKYYLESLDLEAWRALETWGVGPDDGDELFRKCWGAAYISGNAAMGVERLLGVMDEVIAFCKKRSIEVPASFREARSRVEAAVEAEWEKNKQRLAEMKRQFLEKYPEPAPSDITRTASAERRVP